MDRVVVKKLQAEVAEQYNVLAGHGVGEYRYNGKIVHLEQIDAAEAKNLVENGFPYLVPKVKKGKAVPTPTDNTVAI